MKLGIMQPYFFPYIGYWQLMSAVDTYVIYDDVNYIKNGWINRNRILIQGKPAYINLQLRGASSAKHINQISVNQNEIMLNKNLKTLHAAYAKAPYYDHIMPLIENILSCGIENVAEYLAYSFHEICTYIGITTKLILSSELEKDCSLKGQDKILHICKLLNATKYYNAIGGVELYNVETFAENGIELKFIQTEDIVYPQYKNEFQPNLSIIDVMMFNSVEDIQKMLGKYILI